MRHPKLKRKSALAEVEGDDGAGGEEQHGGHDDDVADPQRQRARPAPVLRHPEQRRRPTERRPIRGQGWPITILFFFIQLVRGGRLESSSPTNRAGMFISYAV